MLVLLQVMGEGGEKLGCSEAWDAAFAPSSAQLLPSAESFPHVTAPPRVALGDTEAGPPEAGLFTGVTRCL